MDCRPWGLLDWALRLTKPRRWDFLGALGTEERSLAPWRWLKQLDGLSRTRLLEVLDLPSRHTPRAQQLTRERERAFLGDGGKPQEITRGLDLLAELHRIVAIAHEVEAATAGSVMLDITSLPKRFFFPILRHLEQSTRVRDLVLTYTSPDRYLEGDALSEGATDWVTLPGFHAQDGGQETLVVSAGFMVESLHNHLATVNKPEPVKMLIPFPAPLAVLRRTWDSVFSLEAKRASDKFEHHRVDPADLPGAFERIVSLARDPSVTLAFAPFGPKPISAAMCLYASPRECSVYYPQPRHYHPDYSQGVGEVDGKPAVFAYWIKHAGNRLYEI